MAAFSIYIFQGNASVPMNKLLYTVIELCLISFGFLLIWSVYL